MSYFSVFNVLSVDWINWNQYGKYGKYGKYGNDSDRERDHKKCGNVIDIKKRNVGADFKYIADKMHVEFYLKCQRHTDAQTDTETRISRSILHNYPPLKTNIVSSFHIKVEI